MRLTKTIREIIRGKILADLPPRVDYEAKAQALVDEESVDQLPHALQASLISNKDVKNYLRRQYQNGLPFSLYAYADYQCSDATRVKILGLSHRNREQYEQRCELSYKLDAMLKSVTTVKKFVETFPEFAKYAPSEAEPVKQLPANDIIKELEALGWKSK